MRETLQSVINQTYPHLELLVVDDGSTDGTLEIIRELEGADSRVRLIQNTTNLGLVGNWNRCMELVRTEWMKFQFQDDLMMPHAIERMLDYALANSTNLVISHREYFGDHSDVKAKRMLNNIRKRQVYLADFLGGDHVISPYEMAGYLKKSFLQHNFIGEPILGLMKKDLFDRYGRFDDRLKQWVDFEMWLRIMTNESTGFIGEPLHQFRVHQLSQTSKNKSASNELGITTLDFVYLIDLLKKGRSYKMLRDLFNERFPRNLDYYANKRMLELVRKKGYEKFESKFGTEYLEDLSWSKTDAMRSRLHLFLTKYFNINLRFLC